MSSSTTPTSLAPLYWLAPGTFAVGTESFMIAGLLPDMAADLHTSIVAAACEVAALILAVSIGRRLAKVRNAAAIAACGSATTA